MKFGRDRRLRARREFQLVRENGAAFVARTLVLSRTLAMPEGCTRFGIITTKKLGNAVVRNRLRRQVRALLQRHGDVIQPGYWLSFIPRYHAVTESFTVMERDFLYLLRKASLHSTPQKLI